MWKALEVLFAAVAFVCASWATYLLFVDYENMQAEVAACRAEKAAQAAGMESNGLD